MLLRNCQIVDNGRISPADIRIRGGRIDAIAAELSVKNEPVIEVGGRVVLPGLVDDQVHFREPGLTHKADIASESRAAAAGGVTSYMEMPNTSPPTLTAGRLAEKKQIARRDSRVNYGFYLGASVDNLEDIRRADPCEIAGVKIFMGSSTGGMLVDDESILRKIFSAAPCLIAVHCENSKRIAKNMEAARKKFGANIPPEAHPQIRDSAACFESSQLAVALARETGARLHILHITTARELELFSPGPHSQKQITAEACVHHLLLDDSDYATGGFRLKCNPAIKTRSDRDAIRAAVREGRIDVIATDHAPHLLSEKGGGYADVAAGMPLAEFSLPILLELENLGALTLNDIARAASRVPAEMFGVVGRGRICEGFWADLAIVDDIPKLARDDKVLAKCAWTPFHGRTFSRSVWMTLVNGEIVWSNGKINDNIRGRPLEFRR